MAFLKIDDVDMPTPSSFSVSSSDLDSDSTKRNEEGLMQRDRVREGVRKLSCKWSGLTQSDCSVLMAAFKPASFTVTYPDPELGVTTITAYAGDRAPEMIKYLGEWRWTLSCDLIQY